MNHSIKRQLSNEEQAKLAEYSPLLAHLLFHRGILNREDANKFLNPDYTRDIHDPFLLKDAEKATERIIQAIKNNERAVIYADYDADGIPGAVIFHDLFTRIGFENFSIYIPHRHDEGFGLNVEAVEQLAGEGVKLLVTIDCGISDIEAVARANELKIDVIITDHHEPPKKLPQAFAIVDHKQIDCEYPDKNICGSAVAYKLIQAILEKDRFGLKEGHEKWFLDMVGIATLSDMVSLTGENRVFAYYGMSVLRKSQRKGLKKLFEKLRINQNNLTEDDIGFMITPRINAASRMGVPMDAFKLLSADNDTDAKYFADHLDGINNERKGVVAALVKEVKKVIKERYGSLTLTAPPLLAGGALPRSSLRSSSRDSSHPSGGANNSLASAVSRSRESVSPEDAKRRKGETANDRSDTVFVDEINTLPDVIVLGNPAWRPSLLGLVANTCAQEFNRPFFLWGRDGDNVIKGSCRSEGRANIMEIMRAVPEGIFTQMGGHKHSGGFAVSNEQIHFLDRHLNEAFLKNQKSNLNPSAGGQNETQEENIIDAELTLDSVNWDLFKDIDKLAPFGKGNPKPVFLFKNIVPASIRKFGKRNEHVEIVFKKQNDEKISAISFFGAESEWAKTIQTGKLIDLIASLEKSVFRREPELKLRVVNVNLNYGKALYE
ncbi:MAG: DHH family phosphoesterase [Patescibacteria group bacterium]